MSSETPVSIVLPTLNCVRYLADALQSIWSQTHRNLELIVVDGGSTDGTLQVLERGDDPRLRVIHQPSNHQKLPGALNLGFQSARGEYRTWMQADCTYGPEAIAYLAAFLDHHAETGFVYADFWAVDESNALTLRRAGPASDLASSNCVGHYFMWRREVGEATGEFDPAAYLVEDYEYWMRVSKCCQMRQLNDLPEPMFYYREHPGALTSLGYTRVSRDRIALRFRRKHFDLSWRQYWLGMAESYLEEAFYSRQRGDFQHMRRSVVQSVLRNPFRPMRDRGAARLFAEAMLGQAAIGRLRR